MQRRSRISYYEAQISNRDGRTSTDTTTLSDGSYNGSLNVFVEVEWEYDYNTI